MSRTKLPDRRASETRKLSVTLGNGTVQTILITIGFNDDGIAKEVFCADFKAGSDLHAMIMDACILVSRALQYGDSAADLVASMCEGPSLLGTIVAAVADSQGPRTRRDSRGEPVQPRPTPTAPAGAAVELVP